MTTMEQVYMDTQAACGLKVGDYVKVLRKAESYEAGWWSRWPADMDKYVGQIGRIYELHKGSIRVGLATGEWWNFPYFVLEKTEKPEHKFKPFEKVLVRQGDTDEWECALYGRKDGDVHRMIGHMCWYYCIPYEGNEHLVGKTE